MTDYKNWPDNGGIPDKWGLRDNGVTVKWKLCSYDNGE